MMGNFLRRRRKLHTAINKFAALCSQRRSFKEKSFKDFFLFLFPIPVYLKRSYRLMEQFGVYNRKHNIFYFVIANDACKSE